MRRVEAREAAVCLWFTRFQRSSSVEVLEHGATLTQPTCVSACTGPGRIGHDPCSGEDRASRSEDGHRGPLIGSVRAIDARPRDELVVVDAIDDTAVRFNDSLVPSPCPIIFVALTDA